MWLKETNVIVLVHMETNILRNGNEGAMNCIMGSSVFVAMSTT
jgi:hypothetical protein